MTAPAVEKKPLTATDMARLEAEAKELWDGARTQMVINRPFFAALALARPPIVDWTCDTAWTDGRNFGYNPAYVVEQGHDKVIGLNIHEVWHVALKHHLRREERDFEDWNIATDAAINRLVEMDGFVLPDGGVPAWHNDESAEEIFGQLPPHPKGGGGGGVEIRDLKNPDGSPITDAQAKQIEAEINQAVQSAINTARVCGKLPAALDRAVQAAKSTVPWKELLADFLSQFARDDYSWMHPDLRFKHLGFILPGLYSEEQGRICFTGDTSGSQDIKDLEKIAGELLFQLEQLANRGEAMMPVCWWDTDIYVQYITCKEDIKPRGGGGTDAAKMFEWVKGKLEAKDEQGQKVEPGEIVACVVMTDGLLDVQPESDPGVPVLWILTRENRGFKPPFGRVAWTMDN